MTTPPFGRQGAKPLSLAPHELLTELLKRGFYRGLYGVKGLGSKLLKGGFYRGLYGVKGLGSKLLKRGLYRGFCYYKL